ncbi:MAG TPA: DEAD/DEAH box helicase [Acidimicrobiia bacterium]|nr:DEAD/DEAH box helicase [Acidimicrobiia bacterium]
MARDNSSVERFFAGLAFQPDDFQREAIASVAAGRSVVVTAPTGAGKTLVAEGAVHLSLERGERAFYTTPIKALSNQKYGDLVATYGSERVGLLTGDNVVNGDAEVVVMTTEVLRNMIYAGSAALDRVGAVVLDEVHYLQDRYRGAVWEEVIIHGPRRMQLVCLSATIANAEEFAAWVRERRGPTDLVISMDRPIPLEPRYLFRDRVADALRLMPTFSTRDGRQRPNPKLEHILSLERGRRNRFATPGRVETVEHLAGEGMLPAIYFIFSRAGCDAAALRLLEAGTRLTTPDEREAIRAFAERRTAHLSDDDLAVLDYPRWVSELEAGVAPHHAGMVPAFKETVEQLFAAGLLKVVFATETLALGINMPARTVVLESLSKWTGEGHEIMPPGDYTQLTGRAGRRGIDVVGYGVVLHSPFVPFSQVTAVAAAGSHPLRSSFRATYNMAANLAANYDRETAEQLLAASFGQFQRQEDRSAAVQLLADLEGRLDEEEARAKCELGSIDEYLTLADAGPPPRKVDLVGRLHPGDVIDIPGGPRQGRYVILRRIRREGGGMKLLALGTAGRVVALGMREVVAGTGKRTTIDLPKPFAPKDRRFQQDALRMLRRIAPATASEPSPQPENRRIEHPVADCSDLDTHVKWARRAARTRKRLDQISADLRQSGLGLVEDFQSIVQLLDEFGYIGGWVLTPRGERLRFIYNEMDLLLAETLERGLFWGLDVPELAAFASCFVYEPRTEERLVPVWPTALLADRWAQLEAISEELALRERALRLPLTRRPDPGFATLAYDWANGESLDDLASLRLAPGDFVRVSRQLVDLVRQLRDVSPELATEARAVLGAIDRGVVAAMGVG